MSTQTKAQKITYWIATLWLSLGMASTGIIQLIHQPEEVKNITQLGYPVYFLTILGIWKLLGVIAVLIPRTPLLKEWAYAGFFFAMTGAAASRLLAGDGIALILPCLLLLTLTLLSYYFRPATRKVQQAIQVQQKIVHAA